MAIRMTIGSGNVFLDLGFSKPEAENLRLRAQLMREISAYCRESGKTHAAAARVLGLSQRRLSLLLKGRIGLFSLDVLVGMATRAGLGVRLVLKKAA